MNDKEEPRKGNEKIEEIIATYPKRIQIMPRRLFEDQLRQHLKKHKVGL